MYYSTAAGKIGTALFYTALVLLLFSSFHIIEDAVPVWFPKVSLCMKYLATVLCLARIAMIGIDSPRYAVTCFCLFVLLFISSRLGLNNNLTFTFALVAASRGADSRVILRIYLCFFVLMLLLNPAMYLAVISGNITKHRMGMTGNSWGFQNPNTLAYVLMVLTFLVCSMPRFPKRPALLFTVSWIMAGATFLLTLSATCSLLLMIFPAACLLLERMKSRARWTAALPAAALLFSVLMAAAVGPGYGDNTFLCRFSIPRLSYSIYGLSWLGQDAGTVLPQSAMHEGFTEPLCLDNTFLCLPLRDGIIPAIIFMAFLSCLLYRIASSGRPVLLAAAVCIVISGLMESYPSNFILNFPLLLFFSEERKVDLRVGKALCLGSVLVALAALFYIHSPWLHFRSPEVGGRARISDIAVPDGSERIDAQGDEYKEFLRNLPLAPEGTPVMYYEKPDRAEGIEPYCHRVVNMPLISPAEQCADVCMHLRADYLFRSRQYCKIHFEDTQHGVMRYPVIAGRLEEAYRNFLIKVFDRSNTESLRNEMIQRSRPEDVEIGDVWCYDVHARDSVSYGHAMMVADVAVDRATGEKIVLLVQGSKPSCSIHVLRNTLEPGLSPWFRLKGEGDFIDFGFARYRNDELYHFQ